MDAWRRTMKNSPAIPAPRTLADAIDRHDGLASLAKRLAQSDARWAAVRSRLPEPLCEHLRPGPIDDEGWTVLASNAAVAAKLRHLLPHLQSALREQGWPELEIRVRIRAR
jgi:Dna[CI] antecedent, DciA